MTAQELIATFFATPSVGHRRLRRLSGLDLIATHRKGVPEKLPYSAWRLTPRGLDAVAEAFPDEVIPDGLSERLADGNLYHIDHRAAISRLYLALLCARSGPVPGEAQLAAVRAVMGARRARADELVWQADGDVVLRFDRLGVEAQIVPDATVSARHRAVRVFIEMDRGTRGLSRIGEALERYAWFLSNDYARVFPDGKNPCVVYVTPPGRKPGVADTATRVLGPNGPWAVVTEKEGPGWLEAALVDPAHDGEPIAVASEAAGTPETLREAARNVYTWARTFERSLRAEGKGLPAAGQEVLLELYRELKGKRHAG